MRLARFDLAEIPLLVGRAQDVELRVDEMFNFIWGKCMSVYRDNVAMLARRKLDIPNPLDQAVVVVEPFHS